MTDCDGVSSELILGAAKTSAAQRCSKKPRFGSSAGQRREERFRTGREMEEEADDHLRGSAVGNESVSGMLGRRRRSEELVVFCFHSGWSALRALRQHLASTLHTESHD